MPRHFSDAPGFDETRRNLLKRAAAFAGVLAAPSWAQALPGALMGEEFGVRPGGGDQSRALQRALERSAREGRPLALTPGVYRVANVQMPDGATLVGAPDLTRLELSGVGPILSARGVRRVSLRGVTLDGANIPGGTTGVFLGEDVEQLTIDDCAVLRGGASGIHLTRVGGAVRTTRIEAARQAAVFSIDGKGVAVTDCAIIACRNNGVLVRRSVKSDDPSLVSRNRIEDTGALDGGLGWNGNAVNVSKANGVVVSDNQIRRSAFTAIRAHESDDVMMTDNLCLQSGETGLYAEFGFTGCVISGNLVDGAANGISVANFNEGGRLGAVTGNVVRNLFRRKKLDDEGDGYGSGIGVEADIAVTGNVVENAPDQGVGAGWGPYLRDVTISGNVIRGCEVGVGVSVVEGVGPATIVANTITGSRRGAVLGYRWLKIETADLAVSGAPVLKGLTVAQNTIR